MKTTGGLKPWGLTRVKVQREKNISDGDQDVKGAGMQGIEGVKGEFPGAGRTHQIHGECKRMKVRQEGHPSREVSGR